MRLTLVATEEEGEFVSTCPELGIASQGATVEEAFANLKDATLTYLRTIEDLGERDRIFKERRIKIWAGNPDVGTVRLKLAPQQFGATFAAPVRRNSERKATHAKSR